jgi:hypothetical protein
MMRRSVLALALVLSIATLTCKDATSGPTPGYLEVRLASPNVDDGGVHFTIGGAKIDSVTTAFPVIAVETVNDSLWHVAVGGNIGTGVVARIWVPDTREVNQYTGTVLEVVVRTTYAQRSQSGYAVIAAAP